MSQTSQSVCLSQPKLNNKMKKITKLLPWSFDVWLAVIIKHIQLIGSTWIGRRESVRYEASLWMFSGEKVGVFVNIIEFLNWEARECSKLDFYTRENKKSPPKSWPSLNYPRSEISTSHLSPKDGLLIRYILSLYIYTYIHIYIYTYIHTYIHTYMHAHIYI